MSIAIVWFRNDLRVHDHEPFFKALANHETVIPFYCFEKKQFQKTGLGLDKTGNHRTQFLIESVQNLKKNLQEKGSDLIIRFGDIKEEISILTAASGAKSIYCYKDIHQEEIQSQIQVESIEGIKVNYCFGSTLFHVNDAPFIFSETPNVFTQFRKELEKKSKPRAELIIPQSLPQIPEGLMLGELPALKELNGEETTMDSRAAIKAKGGEDEALARLNHYFFKSKELNYYKQKRNGLIGSDYSSKLSLWLWNGCISPRRIYWEVKRYEQEEGANQSTYWLVFELIWRDYFKFIALKYGNKIFLKGGIKGKEYPCSKDEEIFWKWANGETGIPFIDSNMKELNQTGFMSNRGRQNVASFLVKELNLDWRMGAAYFEDKLIDYDVASNYGNWMYIAGVGNDPRDRYFNIILQAKRYDSKGEYVKMWLPELSEIDADFIHHPWTRESNLFGKPEIDYPKPLVEPEYWKKHY